MLVTFISAGVIWLSAQDPKAPAGEGVREEQAGAGLEVAEGVHQSLLPLVGGHEIHVAAGLLDRPCGLRTHRGHARASPPGWKAALHACGSGPHRRLAGEDDPVVAPNLCKRLVERLPGGRR